MATETPPWRRVILRRLTYLLHQAPNHLRWTTDPTGKLLRSPRGQLWELKLRHGARMRPADPPPSPP